MFKVTDEHDKIMAALETLQNERLSEHLKNTGDEKAFWTEEELSVFFLISSWKRAKLTRRESCSKQSTSQ